jgi:hypothetical protein
MTNPYGLAVPVPVPAVLIARVDVDPALVGKPVPILQIPYPVPEEEVENN